MNMAAVDNLAFTIKGTAMNKDRARVWVESAQLARFGFERGARYNIEHGAGVITVRLEEGGARKVAGRERRGKSISILDLCMPVEERARLFNGAERLRVIVMHGTLTITAEEAAA